MLIGLLALAAPASSLAAEPSPEDPAEGWNRVYRNPDSSYVREPSSFLVRCVERLAREGLASPGASALVLAMGDGRVRLEVGYGLEDRIPDAVASSIVRDVREELGRSDVFSAVDGVVRGVIARTNDVVADPVDGQAPKGRGPWTIVIVVVLGLAVLAGLGRFVRRRQRTKRSD